MYIYSEFFTIHIFLLRLRFNLCLTSINIFLVVLRCSLLKSLRFVFVFYGQAFT